MAVSPGDPAAKLEEILEKIKIKVTLLSIKIEPACYLQPFFSSLGAFEPKKGQ